MIYVVLKDYGKCENKRHDPILRKQEWLKVQHLIKCPELCNFCTIHHQFINNSIKDLSHVLTENQPMHRKRKVPKTKITIFVTKSDENHTMSLFNPILNIPERS